jgi:hypothetical protein
MIMLSGFSEARMLTDRQADVIPKITFPYSEALKTVNLSES